MNIDTFMGKLRGKQVKGEIYFGYVKFNMHIRYLKGEGVRRSMEVSGVWENVRVGNINVSVISI